MKRIILLLLVALVLPMTACSDKEEQINNEPIPYFVLERYLGTWYEIARYDHKFERDLENVIAEYSLQENDKVRVLNSGRKDGKLETAEGVAIQPQPNTNPAHLRVSFFMFFYSDYRILYIDSDYQYALVGSKSEDYLWLLSRNPQLTEDQKSILLMEAHNRGYDTSNLIWVNQSANIRSFK